MIMVVLPIAMLSGTIALLALLFAGVPSDADNTTEVATITPPPPIIAQSACNAPSSWPQATTYFTAETYRLFSMQVLLPDLTPIQGMCITILLDAVPVYPLSYVGACRTGVSGRCSLAVPPGLLRLHFDETIINSQTLDLSVNEIQFGPTNPTDNLAFLVSDDDTTASATLVIVTRTDETFTIKNVRPDADGRLTILNPDLPDWAEQPID